MHRLARAFAAAALATSATLLVGCSSGAKLDKYAEPKPIVGQTAKLDGFAATYITVVDNCEVSGVGPILLANFGGNKVTLAPGWHRVTIKHLADSGHVMTTYIIAMQGTFKPGHDYSVGPSSRFNPFNQGLVIRDKHDNSILPFD